MFPINPWKAVNETGTLKGDLATFEINGQETPDMEAEVESDKGGEPEASMKLALETIMQQSTLIRDLLAQLKAPK